MDNCKSRMVNCIILWWKKQVSRSLRLYCCLFLYIRFVDELVLLSLSLRACIYFFEEKKNRFAGSFLCFITTIYKNGNLYQWRAVKCTYIDIYNLMDPTLSPSTNTKIPMDGLYNFAKCVKCIPFVWSLTDISFYASTKHTLCAFPIKAPVIVL